ncbi:MAG: aldo/keto reductase, partial [Polyangiaceae bacterium]|nr:aldo/keto reductase [Polyangiaceae bacterium]
LVHEGKARAIGLSNHSPAAVRRALHALSDVPLASLQDDYSLVSRWPENELLPLCRAHDVGFLCYSPLARGLLSGRAAPGALAPSDPRRGDVLFHSSNLERVLSATEVLGEVARERGEQPATTALVWLASQPGVTSVVVGARTPEQAIANAEALGKRLEREHEARLRSAFEAVRIDRAAGRGRLEQAIGLARRAAGKARRLFSRW